MAKGDANLLLGILMFFVIYSFIINIVIEHAIVEGEIQQPPRPPTFEGGDLLGNTFDGIAYFGQVIIFYFDIFFNYDTSITALSSFMLILSVIAIYLLLKDIIIPIVAIVVPDWL